MNEHQKSINGTITSTQTPTERNYPQVQPSKSEIANIHKVSGLHHFPNFKRLYNYSIQTDCSFSFSRETPQSTF